jgi:hypothetical protein
VKWLLWLYPRRWRSRYGDEFLVLLEQRGVSPTMLLDVLRGAVDAWLHPELGAVPAHVGGNANPARRRDRFDKFTRGSRIVLDLAAKEAQRLGHQQITTDHLLLGLLLECDGVAAHVLQARGVNSDEVRARILDHMGSAAPGEATLIGLSPDAKRSIELSVAEANRLRHHYVGTEHLLQVLRSHVVRVLSEGGPHLRA